MLPSIFSLPIMKAVVGFKSPSTSFRKFSSERVIVQSASRSSLVTVFGLLSPSKKMIPSSPKSNLIVASIPPSSLTLRKDGFHLTVTLNRPEARNAMSAAMAQELAAVFEATASNPAIAAIVLRGAGKHFCAGGDLKDMTDAIDPPAPGEPDTLYEVNRRFGDLLARVDSAPQAVVAVVQGAARGGGFGLICASDIVIAQRSATYAMPETGFGLPGAQIIPFVSARLGAHYARNRRRLSQRSSRFLYRYF